MSFIRDACGHCGLIARDQEGYQAVTRNWSIFAAMNENQELRQPNVFIQVALWLTAGIAIGSMLWMPLFRLAFSGN
jgi:hypothetical protein